VAVSACDILALRRRGFVTAGVFEGQLAPVIKAKAPGRYSHRHIDDLRNPSGTITRTEIARAMSSIIQPRFGEDAYPSGRFVLERAQALGLSRTDVVRRFGYRGLTSGHAAVTGFLLTGVVPPFIRTKLADVLEVEGDLIDNLLLATAQQLHDEARAQIWTREDAYRAAFRPHLQVQTKRQNPSPIFIAALLTTRRLRIVDLPDEAFSADEDTRDRVIKATIVEHRQRQRGHVPAFGEITGYAHVCIAGYDSVDFGLPFDVCGEPAGPMRPVKRLPEATLGTKRGGTGLTGLLKYTPIRVVTVSHDG
jgi:hypothetical protein